MTLSVLEDSPNPLHLFLSFYQRLTSAKCLSSSCTVELCKARFYIISSDMYSWVSYDLYLWSIVHRCNRKTTDDAPGLTVQTNRITRGLTIWLMSFQVKHAISNTLGCRDLSLYCILTLAKVLQPTTKNQSSTGNSYSLLLVYWQTSKASDLSVDKQALVLWYFKRYTDYMFRTIYNILKCVFFTV